MRCLVVGGGGREHALCRALLASPSVEQVLAAPGNPGIAAEPGAVCVPVGVGDLAGLVSLAGESAIDLTVVGPEAPLVAGLVDALQAAGLVALGPSRAAARLEGSKAFAKEVMAAAGVPTAPFALFDDLAAARAALPEGPVVIKADGLAAGKGVVVAPDKASAQAALDDLLGARRFGEAGARVLVEAFLQGEEASVIALCDGTRAACFPAAQDHKRLGEGDTGPNTGGMGAYAPAPCLDRAGVARVRERIILPVLEEMRRRGAPFRGFLYVGLMLTERGPVVLEFNVRLGDPEAQVLLPLLAPGSDLAAALRGAAMGELPASALRCGERSAACVVIASPGYPQGPRLGDLIPIEPGRLEAERTGLQIFHAGTDRDDDGRLRAAGGRVLGVTGVAGGLRSALALAYEAAARLRWPGAQVRGDIGHRALT